MMLVYSEKLWFSRAISEVDISWLSI